MGPSSSSTERPFGQRTNHGRGRGPRGSISFSGVFGTFQGISSATLKGPGEDDAEEEENSVEEEFSEISEASPTPEGESQVTEGPTLSQSN
ncbi:hypothetical protein O181_101953 [Austropuccinia psidii MF-1]|uniref:Uncharacterized protein n=1 Tax=Austropuccinia psidii MF-1 TaxID=1389203 RepID=A0A9Q3JFG3_9BASI|nr:hypothetical protein [Austropuccinia psidii MF-1]